MKNRILSVVAFVLLLTTSTFAASNSDNINQNVLNTFQQDFSQAKNISWNKTNNFYRASFTLNDQFLFAFYSETGEYIGVGRNIPSNQLSLNLQTSLKKDYANYWITDIIEFSEKDQTVFYATVENADQIITLNSSDSNLWSVLKKVRKD